MVYRYTFMSLLISIIPFGSRDRDPVLGMEASLPFSAVLLP